VVKVLVVNGSAEDGEGQHCKGFGAVPSTA